MYQSYYNEIINVVAQNEFLCDLLDKALFKISYELQNELNKNIITFHHSVSEHILIERQGEKIILNICGRFYHMNINEVYKDYINVSSSKENTPYKQDELMIECLLKKILETVKNYCNTD